MAGQNIGPGKGLPAALADELPRERVRGRQVGGEEVPAEKLGAGVGRVAERTREFPFALLAPFFCPPLYRLCHPSFLSPHPPASPGVCVEGLW